VSRAVTLSRSVKESTFPAREKGYPVAARAHEIETPLRRGASEPQTKQWTSLSEIVLDRDAGGFELVLCIRLRVRVSRGLLRLSAW
jgi:hypothetical protein